MSKKGFFKRCTAVLMAAVMMCGMGIAVPEASKVTAAEKPTCEKYTNYTGVSYFSKTGKSVYGRLLKKTTTMMLFPNNKAFKKYNYNMTYNVVLKQLPDKITKISYSKKSIVTLKKMKASKYKDVKTMVGAKGLMTLKAKKAGTTTVTIKGKKNGKKKTYKIKFKVKKYDNPYTYLKINKKNLTKKMTNKKPTYDLLQNVKLGKDKTIKVTIKKKKGYKIDGIYYRSYTKDTDGTGINNVMKKMKNKKKVKRVIPTSFVKSYYKKNYAKDSSESPESLNIYMEKKSKTLAWGEYNYYTFFLYIK